MKILSKILEFHVGVHGLQLLVADGGTAPYRWQLRGGSSLDVLPPGLVFNSGGHIEGVPGAVGEITFVVIVSDSGSEPPVMASITLKVLP